MIKTVFFDLGNVLVFFSLPKLFAQVATLTDLPADKVRKILFESDIRELYETGKIDTTQVHTLLQTHTQKPFSLPDFSHAFSDIFTPNTDLWPVVEELKRQNIRLVLLSNTSECHYDYIESNYPILKLFDHKILSYEVGAWKPDPRIFQKALAHSHCAPEECFYTDDIPEFIEAARKSGLPGHTFTTPSSLKEQLILRGCHF